MNGAAVVAEILKREGTEFLSCYPRNTVIEPCAAQGIRPILCRQARVGVGVTVGGNYSKVAEGLNVASRRVEKPGDIVSGIKEAVRHTETGAPFLLEFVVKEGRDFSRTPLAGL